MSPDLIQSLMKSRKRSTSSSEGPESFPKTDVLLRHRCFGESTTFLISNIQKLTRVVETKGPPPPE